MCIRGNDLGYNRNIQGSIWIIGFYMGNNSCRRICLEMNVHVHCTVVVCPTCMEIVVCLSTASTTTRTVQWNMVIAASLGFMLMCLMTVLLKIFPGYCDVWACVIYNVNQTSVISYQCMWKPTFWHREKFYFTCTSNPWYNMKKIHPAIMGECARMDIWTDRLTDELKDWTLSYLPQFHIGSVGNNKKWLWSFWSKKKWLLVAMCLLNVLKAIFVYNYLNKWTSSVYFMMTFQCLNLRGQCGCLVWNCQCVFRRVN